MAVFMQDQGLDLHGLHTTGPLHWNLPTPDLYEHSIRRDEALVAEGGALVADTSPYTGRSPQDKFIVREPSSEKRIWWENNRETSPAVFEALRQKMFTHLASRELFVRDMFVGADPKFRLPVRVVNEYAWHSLFARNMFLHDDNAAFDPATGFTVINAPTFKANPARDGTRTEVFVMMHLGKRLILIGGTGYAGETKKSIFSAMNYVLPLQNVFPMHCSANIGERGDTAIFFGLSGTARRPYPPTPRAF
jgi:phosphoenolpyruvate carboxykinase (ATP)